MSKIGTQTRRLGEFWKTMERAAEELGVDVDKIVDAVTQDVELAKGILTLAMSIIVNVVARIVTGINREQRSGQQVIDAIVASGRKLWYKDQQAVDEMPRGEGNVAEFLYVKLGKYYNSRAAVVTRLAGFGYELFCDPRAVAEDMIQNPGFADDEPVVCFYGEKDWLAFRRYGGGRSVSCDRGESGWGEFWRVAVRKCPKKPLDT